MIGSAHPFDSVALKRGYTHAFTGFLRFYLLEGGWERRERWVQRYKCFFSCFLLFVFRFFFFSPRPPSPLLLFFDLFDDRLTRIGAWSGYWSVLLERSMKTRWDRWYLVSVSVNRRNDRSTCCFAIRIKGPRYFAVLGNLGTNWYWRKRDVLGKHELHKMLTVGKLVLFLWSWERMAGVRKLESKELCCVTRWENIARDRIG